MPAVKKYVLVIGLYTFITRYLFDRKYIIYFNPGMLVYVSFCKVQNIRQASSKGSIDKF
uniref:Uncharacterized protein n=1 Tax=Rhizophora mucronata TaxID=61149 RepID=A0A2P2IP04_RHIMU